MRFGFPLVLGCALTTACFNPEEPSEDSDASTGTGTGGSGSDTNQPTAGTGPTVDPDSSSGSPTDPTVEPTTTDGVDDPPTVELEIDGTASPDDVTNSRFVQLQAAATDDGTVAMVEFFDEGVLIGTDDTAPFALDLLLTSADNGLHSYSARAVDDAGQDALSNDITLVVTVTGGNPVASETNLFQMGGIVFQPGIGVVLDHDDNVLVAGSLATADFGVVGLGVQSLSPDLSSTNWQLSVPMSLLDGQPQFLTFGQPVLSLDGSQLAIGGNSMGVEGVIQPNVSIFRVATDGTGALPFIELASNPDVQTLGMAGITSDPDGNVIIGGPDDLLTKVQPMPGPPLWQSPHGWGWTLSDLGGHRLRTDAEGDILFDIFACASGNTNCALTTRKINGFDGDLIWEENIPVGANDIFLHVGGSTPSPDGGALTLHGPPLVDGGGLHMVLRDADGSVLEDHMLGGNGDTFAIADLVYDDQGYVVAVGTRFTGGNTDLRTGVAMRFSPTGDVLWTRPFDFGAVDDQGMALTYDPDGRVVVVGISDMELGFLVFRGNVWVAQLDL